MQVVSLRFKCFFFLQVQHLVHGQHKKWIDIKQQCNFAEHLIFDYQTEPQNVVETSVSHCQRYSSPQKMSTKLQFTVPSFRVRMITQETLWTLPWKSKLFWGWWVSEPVRVRVITKAIRTPSYLGMCFPGRTCFGQLEQLQPSCPSRKNSTSIVKFLDFLLSNHTTSKKPSFLQLMGLTFPGDYSVLVKPLGLWDKVLSSNPTRL